MFRRLVSVAIEKRFRRLVSKSFQDSICTRELFTNSIVIAANRMVRHIWTILAIVATGSCTDLRESLEDIEGRIVGGTVVEPPHKYPFQVLFYLSINL